MADRYRARAAAFVANAGSATEIQPGRFGTFMPTGMPQALVERKFEPRLDRLAAALEEMSDRVCVEPSVDKVASRMNPLAVDDARRDLREGFVSGSLLGLGEALDAKHEAVTGIKEGRAFISPIHELVPADAAALLGLIGEYKHTSRGRLMVVDDHKGLIRRVVRASEERESRARKRALYFPAHPGDLSLDGVLEMGARRILHRMSGAWVRVIKAFEPLGQVAAVLRDGGTAEEEAALDFLTAARPGTMAAFNVAAYWYLVREALGIGHGPGGWAVVVPRAPAAVDTEEALAACAERAQVIWERARSRLPVKLVSAEDVGRAPASSVQSAELVGPVNVRSLVLLEDPGGDASRIAFLAPIGWVRAEDAWELRVARVTTTQPVRQAQQRWTDAAMT